MCRKSSPNAAVPSPRTRAVVGSREREPEARQSRAVGRGCDEHRHRPDPERRCRGREGDGGQPGDHPQAAALAIPHPPQGDQAERQGDGASDDRRRGGQAQRVEVGGWRDPPEQGVQPQGIRGVHRLHDGRCPQGQARICRPVPRDLGDERGVVLEVPIGQVEPERAHRQVPADARESHDPSGHGPSAGAGAGAAARQALRPWPHPGSDGLPQTCRPPTGPRAGTGCKGTPNRSSSSARGVVAAIAISGAIAIRKTHCESAGAGNSHAIESPRPNIAAPASPRQRRS